MAYKIEYYIYLFIGIFLILLGFFLIFKKSFRENHIKWEIEKGLFGSEVVGEEKKNKLKRKIRTGLILIALSWIGLGVKFISMFWKWIKH